MDIQELSKEEKLRVIDTILAAWKRYGMEGYICNEIVFLCLPEALTTHRTTDLALTLMPELRFIKAPQIYIYREYGWFGRPKRYPERRTEALRRLKKLIEGQNLDQNFQNFRIKQNDGREGKY
ncbi:MAG: hypothetical protein LBG28_14845 [Tannerella sp.]|nr:hypothetical protein [Tannerella sp.]